jgi:hypothetical protein
MNGKIEDVLDQIGEDVLTEDSKKMLTEAFAEAVDAAAASKVELEVSNALQQLDEDHSVKLEQLLEAIDVDHSNKLVAVLEKIDADHTEKLQWLIKRNKQALQEDASEFKENLLTQLSNYMDLYLEKAIPREELQEAVSNKRANKILEQMKQMISLDDEFINDTIKEAVQDGRNTIDTLKKELSEAVKNNIEVSQALKTKSAELMLEKNTVGLNKDKKNYVLRMLKGKDPDYITENFDYVVKMFDKDEDEQAQLISEEAAKTSRTINEKVDTPAQVNKQSVLTESQIQDSENVDYLSIMKHQDRFK